MLQSVNPRLASARSEQQRIDPPNVNDSGSQKY